MASAGERAYNGGLGAEPPVSMASAGERAYNGGLGAEPPVGVGAKPPEADGILVLEHTFLRSPGGFLDFCKL